MTHLIYEMQTAGQGCGELRHPQEVMKSLGITYQHATPQSMYDCWQFWNCENLPEALPKYLVRFEDDPMKYIGNGLSREAAIKIANYHAPDTGVPS